MKARTNVPAGVASVMGPADLDKRIGIISSGYLMEPTDPEWADPPTMKD